MREYNNKQQGEQDEAIGHMIAPGPMESGYAVGCSSCIMKGAFKQEDIGGRIYRSNIFPYSQNCCECGKVLVEGKKGWPQLFERRTNG